MKVTKNEAVETLQRGIEILIRQKEFNNYKELSSVCGINYNTIKSWMSKRNIPKLKTLDNMCDNLQINTYELFSRNPDFLPIKEIIVNNSRERIRINIRKFLLENTRITINDSVAVFEGEISRDEYISYTRNSHGRSVPIHKLEIIACKLNVSISDLLR